MAGSRVRKNASILPPTAHRLAESTSDPFFLPFGPSSPFFRVIEAAETRFATHNWCNQGRLSAPRRDVSAALRCRLITLTVENWSGTDIGAVSY